MAVTHKATQSMDIALCGRRKYAFGFVRSDYPFSAAWHWRNVTCRACLRRGGRLVRPEVEALIQEFEHNYDVLLTQYMARQEAG
jgi:hypothetical protein